MAVRVGDRAPDFSAEALYQGAAKRIHLVDYLGQWTLLLFYPADFTFV